MRAQNHAATIRQASANLADWAEEEGGFPSDDVDTERAELIGALDALLAANERLTAEVERLRGELEDFATRGTLHDCNPTVMIYADNPQWMQSHQWWTARAQSMDNSVRSRARAALAPEQERT